MSRSISSRAAARLILPLLAVFAGSCTFNEITIPPGAGAVVVHAILNPSVGSQVVLVERTLTGATTVRDSLFDPTDPIATGGGVPVTGAIVEVTDTTGRVTRAVEDKVAQTTRGTGVYRVALSVRLGSQYDLHIRTAEGEDVRGSTRVPKPAVTSNGSLSRNFNRDHDTLLVTWNPVPQSRSYAVRVESPFGPFFLFSDSTRLRLTGDARNLFANDFERLFIPGFRQDMLVAAVDSNFYDYYRTNNDPFTGSGIISRIQGGLGVFGSMVSLTSGTLNVVADQTESIEGRFRLTPAATDLGVPSTITLYVESKSTRSDVPDALSGRYTTNGVNARTDGILGELVGTHVTLVLLANQLAHDTLDVFTGDLTEGTLTGTYRKRSGTAVFVKQ